MYSISTNIFIFDKVLFTFIFGDLFPSGDLCLTLFIIFGFLVPMETKMLAKMKTSDETQRLLQTMMAVIVMMVMGGLPICHRFTRAIVRQMLVLMILVTSIVY